MLNFLTNLQQFVLDNVLNNENIIIATYYVNNIGNIWVDPLRLTNDSNKLRYVNFVLFAAV